LGFVWGEGVRLSPQRQNFFFGQFGNASYERKVKLSAKALHFLGKFVYLSLGEA
jgi:hypothetical protein